MSQWSKGWSNCERSVAIISLVKDAGQLQMRFILNCMTTILKEFDHHDMETVEKNANNHGTIYSVCNYILSCSISDFIIYDVRLNNYLLFY